MSEKRKVNSEKLFITCFLLLVTCYFSACSEKSYKREFVIERSKTYEASLFRQNCAICHGREANGKQMTDGKQVPSLRYGDAAKKSEAEIYEQIKNGKLPMPAFKNQLSDDEIQKMVKFVMRDLQGREQ
jgi:cytochrome c553